MDTVNVTFRVDKKVRQQAEELFANLGLSLSSAFNAFLKQSIREQKLPFELTMNVSSKLTIATKKEVEKAYEEEIKEHLDAYRELAK